MLNQINYIADSLAADSGELNDLVRSGLLQLILSIAYLDENLRRKVQFAAEKTSLAGGVPERNVLFSASL
jgi:hypothetical protein